MTYKIEVKKSVIKELKKIPRDDQIKIAKTIKKFSSNPRPESCIKLADSPYFRVRCGDYRIIFETQDERLTVIILKVGHRRSVYQNK